MERTGGRGSGWGAYKVELLLEGLWCLKRWVSKTWCPKGATRRASYPGDALGQAFPAHGGGTGVRLAGRDAQEGEVQSQYGGGLQAVGFSSR